MTEEEKKAAEELAAKEADEKSQKIEELEKINSGLVEEIKGDRKKRQGLEEDIETLKTTVTQSVKAATSNPEESKIQSVVEEVLKTNDASRAKQNKTVAFGKFIADNKEFHPDNDPTGIKKEALERKLKSFNTEGITEVEDFVKVIGDAKTLLGQDTGSKTTSDEEVKNPYSSTSKSTPSPTEAQDKDLSPKEQKLIKQAGFTKEAYLALKAKQPSFINGLLANVD